MADRYVVKKESGSYYARLIDTETGKVIRKVNVLHKDAWLNLDDYCDMLNLGQRVSSIANDKESRDE